MKTNYNTNRKFKTTSSLILTAIWVTVVSQACAPDLTTNHGSECTSMTVFFGHCQMYTTFNNQTAVPHYR